MKTKRKQYAFGTGISAVGTKPSVAGVVGDISSDFLMTQMMQGIATMFGPKDRSGVLGESIVDSTGSNIIMANGGTVGAVPVEVEGNEIAELPTGDMFQFKGASHEAGGIDTNLPEGTTIFSDRISIDGKTMQERKKSRESKLNKLSKAFESNPSDKISKDAFKRTKSFVDQEEQVDLMIQEVAGSGSQKFDNGTGALGVRRFGRIPGIVDMYNLLAPEQYVTDVAGNPQRTLPATNTMGAPLSATGMPVVPVNLNSGTPIPMVAPPIPNITMAGVKSTPAIPMTTSPSGTLPPDPVGTKGMGMTSGDMSGLLGNIFGGLAPLATTIANRAGDKPNVNAFRNFGNDALEANETAKGYVAGQKADALQDITLQETGSRARNRNSARSVNVQRSLDFASDAIGNKAANDVSNTFAQQMMQLFGQESQLENVQDNVVMGGEQRRDEADRADRDNYYTNLGQNFTNMSATAQNIGKNLNVKKGNDDFLAILPELSKYGLGFEYDSNGKPILKQIKK